jgi:AraC family transcriptional regulator
MRPDHCFKKQEVIMLPNASRDIRHSIGEPGCRLANAGPRTSTATTKIRLLHARTWSGVSAELFEIRTADCGLVEFQADKTCLLVMLKEVGGRAEISTDPFCETSSSYQGANHISLLPKGTYAWCRVGRMGYCRYLLIRFDVDRLDVFLGKGERAKFMQRLMFSDPTIWRYAQLVAEECERPGELSEPYGQSLSLALFLTLIRLDGGEARETSGSRLAPWQLKRVTDFMRDNLADTLQLAQLAAISGLSPSHFGRAFKGSTGLPPHRWQLKMRIEEASAMLADAGASLADIACATGFVDQSHFTRAFAKIVGMNPGAWRRLHRVRA